jgi:hypothetical protein
MRGDIWDIGYIRAGELEKGDGGTVINEIRG